MKNFLPLSVTVASLLMFTTLKSQCLSGTYTIGGASPDYVSFTAAVTDLNANGVCGPVVFDVRAGSYVEQVTITNVPGSSAANTVTFKAESGISASVNLNYPSSTLASGDHVVRLDNADYIQFKWMTLQRTGNAEYARVVYITNGSCFNTFDNVVFYGRSSGVNNLNGSIVYSGATLDTANTFSYSKFFDGTMGMHLDGPASYEGQLNVTNNEFNGQRNIAILATRQKSFLISNNVFNVDTTVVNYVLDLDYLSSSGFITNNKIHGNMGISVSHHNAVLNAVEITNNMITVETQGIRVANSTSVLTVCNSVWSKGNGACFSVFSSSSSPVVNNIFYNENGYKLIDLIPGNGCHNNCYYTSGSVMGTFNSIPVNNNLSTWETTTGIDYNSVMAIPPFVSRYDLHILYDNQLHDKASLGFGIVTDFDLDPRGMTPDIGADEFNISLPDDAGIIAVDSISSSLCAGNQVVYVSLKNFGLNVVNNVTINWTVDGVLQPPYFYVGGLTSQQVDSMIPLGIYNFIFNQANVIKIWTSLPNGNNDPGPLNDTISYIYTPVTLSGVYTVGGVNPDYADINSAINAITTLGVCGNTVFKIRSGTYPTISAVSFPGAGPNATVTFESESGDSSDVIIYGGGIGGAYYRFKKVTFILDPAANPNMYSEILYVAGNHTIVSNCAIISPPTTSSTARCYRVLNTNNELLRSRISGSAIGAEIAGGPVSYGHIVRGCAFYGQSVYSVKSTSNAGIIDSNYIQPKPGQTVRGIFVQHSNPTTGADRITRNHIHANHSIQYGIYITGVGTSPTNVALIANNFIYMGQDTSVGYGIYNFTDNADIINNTVVVDTATNGMLVPLGYWGGGKLYNNVFVNYGTGVTMTINSAPTYFESDYNIFFTPHPVQFFNWATQTGLGNINQLRQQFAGHEIHSEFVNPQLITHDDVHVLSDTNLSNRGTVIPDVTEDIEGDFRGFSPDIGADEFTPAFNYDINVFSTTIFKNNICNTPQPVSVSFWNLGANTITSATIQWKVNGVQQVPVTWNGTLLPGDTVLNFTVGNYLYNRYTDYDILIWTENPNTFSDGNPANDSSHAYLSGIPTVIANSPLVNMVCAGQPLFMHAIDAPDLSYNWSPAALFNSTSDSSVWVTTTTDTAVFLTVVDSVTGCSVTDSFNIYVLNNCCFSGIYTVGGSNPDFTSLGNVSNVLTYGALCGPVVFNIRSGTYTEKLWVPPVFGSSPVNTITFRSEIGDSSAVHIEENVGLYEALIKVDCPNTIISELTCRMNSGYLGSGIMSTPGTNNVIVKNNHIQLPWNVTSCYGIYSDSAGANISIVNNRIDDNSVTPFSANRCIRILGSTTQFCEDLKVESNVIGGLQILAGNTGIQVTYAHSPLIRNNRLNNLEQAIVVEWCSDSVIISGNLGTNMSYYGISLNNITSNSDTAKVFNNMIHMDNTSQNIAVLLDHCEEVFFVNNTISTFGYYPMDAVLYHQQVGYAYVVNNIFEQRSSGSPIVVCIGADTANYFFDHNVYTYAGYPLYVWGFASGDTIQNLSQLNAITGYEASGLVGNPYFVSLTDFHLSGPSSIAAGSGLPIPWITTDIDGDLRDPVPDIGADEVAGGWGWGAVRENIADEEFSLYPNPTRGRFTVALTGNTGSAMLTLYTIRGEELWSQPIINKSQVDISSLEDGIYLVKCNKSFRKIVLIRE